MRLNAERLRQMESSLKCSMLWGNDHIEGRVEMNLSRARSALGDSMHDVRRWGL